MWLEVSGMLQELDESNPQGLDESNPQGLLIDGCKSFSEQIHPEYWVWLEASDMLLEFDECSL